MTDEEITKLIEKTAEQTASKFMLRLNKTGRTAYIFLNSFKKTEELLYLYPKLPEDNAERLRVDKALEKIKDDEYRDVIASRFFDGMTLSEISEIYDCQ